jgi:hypothetical protein
MVVGFLHGVTLIKGNFLPGKGKLILCCFSVLSLVCRLIFA